MSSFILSSFNEEDLVLKMNECQREYAQKNKEIKFFLNYGTVRFALSRQEKKNNSECMGENESSL